MLKQRFITAVILAPLALAAILLLPNNAFTLLLGAILMIGSRELAILAGCNRLAGQLATMVVHATLMTMLALKPDWHDTTLIVAAASWLLTLTWLLRPEAGAARTGGWRLLKLLVATLIIVPTWLALTLLHAHQPWLMLGLLIIIWAADVGAYFCGKSLGRRRLAPRISPGKTLEGLIGGLFTAILVGVLMIYFSHYQHPGYAYAVSAITGVALVSVGGDLLVSLLKRHAGSKDTGQILPGHGGLMDRIDSLCAAAPFYALAVLVAINYL